MELIPQSCPGLVVLREETAEEMLSCAAGGFDAPNGLLARSELLSIYNKKKEKMSVEYFRQMSRFGSLTSMHYPPRWTVIQDPSIRLLLS